MSDAVYPSDFLVGELTTEANFSTSIVGFETGFESRRAVWNRPLLTFTLRYDYLDTEWLQELRDLWLRHQGAADYFRFNDYTDLSPTDRVFGVGDGVTLQYKLQHDFTESTEVKGDGQIIADVYVDPQNGRVLFDVAPAEGVVLTYSAVNAGYRVRFGDTLQYKRLSEGAYGAVRIVLDQVLDDQSQYPIRQVVFGGALAYEELDAVGDAVAFSFAAPKTVTVNDLYCYLSAITAPGVLKLSVCADDNGEPGTEIVSGTLTPGGVGWVTAAADTPAAITRGNRYWFVVNAESGTWDGTHKATVKFCEEIESVAPLGLQDAVLFGGYYLFDLRCDNSPHSWLGAEVRAAGGDWSAHDRPAHGAFFLNNVALTIVGHVQAPLAQLIAGNTWTRQRIKVETTHDFEIDRIGLVFSTGAVPVDDLAYVIEFLSDPGTPQRFGTLVAALSTGDEPIYAEIHLDSPLTIPTGDTVFVIFKSPSAVAPAGWTHYGHKDSWGDFATNWVNNWNSVRWDEDESRAEVSTDGGSSWPTSLMAAWTLRCRGRWLP